VDRRLDQQTRNPKAERRPKSEARRPKELAAKERKEHKKYKDFPFRFAKFALFRGYSLSPAGVLFGFRSSDFFRISGFGLRIFQPIPPKTSSDSCNRL
jgi:hypothetical protein